MDNPYWSYMNAESSEKHLKEIERILARLTGVCLGCASAFSTVVNYLSHSFLQTWVSVAKSPPRHRIRDLGPVIQRQVHAPIRP